MSEYQGTSIRDITANLPLIRERFAAIGVPADVAAERARQFAQRLDASGFDVPIATMRPELWKRMNRRPSRLRTAMDRARRILR